MIIKICTLSVCRKMEGWLKLRKLSGGSCSFSVINSGRADINGKLYNQYGIMAKSLRGTVAIDGITTERSYAEDVARYLNINRVCPEHFHQVVEELLCQYPDIDMF